MTMENIDPVAEMEPGSPRTKNVQFSLDTHAMAYKLLLSDSGFEETETVSEYGKEARMDFYKNRSRSDGASIMLKSCLEELKQRKNDEDSDFFEETEPAGRRRSSFADANRKKLSEPSKLPSMAAAAVPEGPKLEMPQRPPLLFVPAVDSCDHSPTYERDLDRRKLFSQNRFVPYFTLPSPSFTLHCLVDERKICLESIESKNAQLSGTILLKRSPAAGCRDDRRRVFARMTLDEWASSRDVDARFVRASDQRSNIDRFVIGVNFGAEEVGAGTRLEFALAYEIECSDGQKSTYWDNNNNSNYAFWYSA